MKKYLPIIFLLLFAASTFATESGLNPAGEAFVKAVNAGNADAVSALYLDGATSYPPDVPVLTGKEAIRKSWADLFTQFSANLELTNGFYENHGDISIAWGQFVMTLTPKAGGQPIKIEGRYTDASKLEQGKWLYIVDHASVAPTQPPGETK